ncbi:DUF1761 domain-containing protein [Rhodoluna sp.]|uniref:DUF1761 domain-containing protein n=1 Tax=Rhodoluna sp. TaxID=1969481 RepID=UPI0025D9A87F|nr:DUF1761 domain-containing protein [Rhodoluna sp.]
MDISNINWLAVFVASLSSFAIGAIWFGPKTFYPTWIKAQGREVPTERIEMSGGETALMFGGTYVAALVQVATLAIIIELARAASITVDWSTGAVIGFAFSVGLGAFGSLSHRMFGQADHKVYRSIKVWLIEVGQDVLAVTVAGIILGAWF